MGVKAEGSVVGRARILLQLYDCDGCCTASVGNIGFVGSPINTRIRRRATHKFKKIKHELVVYYFKYEACLTKGYYQFPVSLFDRVALQNDILGVNLRPVSRKLGG